jgi:hypothetical protein
MALERWGSLSTADHLDTEALVANVLLYDRLVFPVMTEQPDREELPYWIERGWHPDLQSKRIEALGALAVPREWSFELRQRYRSRFEELAAEQRDAARLGGDLTRIVLAQELPPMPPGVAGALIVPAYNSLAGLRLEGGLRDSAAGPAPPPGQVEEQALLITRRLAVIDLPEPEQSLKLAVALSGDASFRARRQALFEWQQLKASQGYGAQAVVDELSALTEEYNQAVLAATKKVYWKYAFMVCGVGAGFVFGALPGAAAAASIAVARFWMFDRKPDAVNDASRPAAMFHDIEQRVGLKLAAA